MFKQFESGGRSRAQCSKFKIRIRGMRMIARKKIVRISCLIAGLINMPAAGQAQTLAQLIDGAKKEGQLVLSWGTGTMGGIEGAQTMEKAFNKKYGLNLPFKFSPGPAMPQFASRIIQEEKAGQPASSDLFIGS
jgi:hypothetical protein